MYIVCAYKDGEVIIDTAAGVLGRYDPRPVQPDSLFPVFSATKGITAGMLHWLADTGKLNLKEDVANIWPEFGSFGKHNIKVHRVLNHTSGLHNAVADLIENPLLISDWEECLNRVALSEPETEPGQEQLYHYLTFGVESRLATLTPDTEDLKKLSGIRGRPDMPSTFQPEQFATTLPVLFIMLNVRRAMIPAANGHFSARALARYYAALADGGVVPPPHFSSSKPSHGSHPHIPKFPAQPSPKQQKGNRSKKIAAAFRNMRTSKYEKTPQDSKDQDVGSHSRNTSSDSNTCSASDNVLDEIVVNPNPQKDGAKIFSNPRIHDAFMGVGEYAHLVKPDGKFGLGFKRYYSQDGSLIGFGHSGMGGSTAFCDIKK
ncbi:hypothetical protein DVH24_012291 [Malus domestica]|uniref:Beta-lactamase-related domain-containing protein n=1 Tax=Malus domestica TaxID=3750 RepID=A0A498HT04_MALDO|nr:hypothetical protein DVH24_012291 [Malus domestica]